MGFDSHDISRCWIAWSMGQMFFTFTTWIGLNIFFSIFIRVATHKSPQKKTKLWRAGFFGKCIKKPLSELIPVAPWGEKFFSDLNFPLHLGGFDRFQKTFVKRAGNMQRRHVRRRRLEFLEIFTHSNAHLPTENEPKGDGWIKKIGPKAGNEEAFPK